MGLCGLPCQKKATETRQQGLTMDPHSRCGGWAPEEKIHCMWRLLRNTAFFSSISTSVIQWWVRTGGGHRGPSSSGPGREATCVRSISFPYPSSCLLGVTGERGQSPSKACPIGDCLSYLYRHNVGLSLKMAQKHQLVKNAMARLLSEIRCGVCIILALKNMHQLSHFRMLVLTSKALIAWDQGA